MPFLVEPFRELPEVLLLRPTVLRDERGAFLETWRAEHFADMGIEAQFVQANRSTSARGVVRGLHHQLPPQAQSKLMQVAAGAVFDVAVDIRRSSRTFVRWVGHRLDADEGLMMWIPEGFTHGFLSLEDDTTVTYLTTAAYAPDLERGVRWDDPAIGIEWPSGYGERLLSDRDRGAPRLGEADVFA